MRSCGCGSIGAVRPGWRSWCWGACCWSGMAGPFRVPGRSARKQGAPGAGCRVPGGTKPLKTCRACSAADRDGGGSHGPRRPASTRPGGSAASRQAGAAGQGGCLQAGHGAGHGGRRATGDAGPAAPVMPATAGASRSPGRGPRRCRPAAARPADAAFRDRIALLESNARGAGPGAGGAQPGLRRARPLPAHAADPCRTCGWQDAAGALDRGRGRARGALGGGFPRRPGGAGGGDGGLPAAGGTAARPQRQPRPQRRGGDRAGWPGGAADRGGAGRGGAPARRRPASPATWPHRTDDPGGAAEPGPAQQLRRGGAPAAGFLRPALYAGERRDGGPTG